MIRWNDGDYSLLILTSAQPYSAAQLSAVVPLPSGQGADEVSWSDDGASLAYTNTQQRLQSGTVEVLPVDKLPAAALTRGHDPVTVTDASARILSAGNPITSPDIGWRPGRHALAMHDESRIVQMDVRTGAVSTAFALPSGATPIETAGWLADGSGLLFAIGYPGNGECTGTHADFYLFTPS